MTRAFIVLKSANTDTISIAGWYAARGVDLDLCFLKALEKCYVSIEHDPLRIHPEGHHSGVPLCRTFPIRCCTRWTKAPSGSTKSGTPVVHQVAVSGLDRFSKVPTSTIYFPPSSIRPEASLSTHGRQHCTPL